MINVKVEWREGKKELFASIEGMKKNLKNTRALNKKRAEAFKDFVIQRIESGTLDFGPEATKISAATAKISPHGDHHPMSDTGYLLSSMIIKSYANKDAAAGYWTDSKRYPGSDLSINEIVTLQSTGFKISLVDNNVRKFLAYHGIFPGPDTTFLTVPPRPFVLIGAAAFAESGADQAIIEEFIRNI